jgi:hypothetical protein
VEYLEKYEHFLQKDTDVPELIVQTLWNLKMYTATVFGKNTSKTNHA